MGSTVLILNGSMIVLNESGLVMLVEGSVRRSLWAVQGPIVPPRARLLLGPLEPLGDPLEEVFDCHFGDPVKQSPVGDFSDEPQRWLVAGAES